GDLRGSRDRPTGIQYPGWHSAAASRAPAKVTRLVPIRARLGYGAALHKTVRQATVRLGQTRQIKKEKTVAALFVIWVFLKPCDENRIIQAWDAVCALCVVLLTETSWSKGLWLRRQFTGE